MARDMKEEYRRVVSELGLSNLKNMTLNARKELMVVKRQIVALLLAKVGMGDIREA